MTGNYTRLSNPVVLEIEKLFNRSISTEDTGCPVVL